PLRGSPTPPATRRRPGTNRTSVRAARRTAPRTLAPVGPGRQARAPSGCPREGSALFCGFDVETRAGARSSYSAVMDAVVLRPGEGESLFNGRIVIKADFDQLCITESHFDSARDGASPHFHRQHADSFYVLEGGLAVLVVDEEKLLSANAFAS